VIVRRERPQDAAAIRTLTRAAFGREPEADLVDALRADSEAYINALSLVAEGADGQVVGHVICSRARIGEAPALGLGPLSVAPDAQGRGVGSALVHAVLGAADAMDEPVVVLLGDPRYYARFGFVLASEHAIEPPVAEWAPHFQARTLAAYDGRQGAFRYAPAFDAV
jgi:putative acetyltransferase